MLKGVYPDHTAHLFDSKAQAFLPAHSLRTIPSKNGGISLGNPVVFGGTPIIKLIYLIYKI